MNEDIKLLPPVEVPAEALSPEALTGIIDNFILREGTDYGSQEVSFEAKVERIRRQLARQEIIVVYDPNTESVSLLTRLEWKQRQNPRKS